MNRPVPPVRPGDNSLVYTLAGGGMIGYREFGDPGGEPLFFFHGWPGSAAQGIFLDGPGKSLRLRVIAVDRPGIGRSTFIEDRHFLHIPPLVDELATALGMEQFSVVGVSGGGPYALACAWAIPHRIRAVAVCCGAPPIDSPEARRLFSPVYRALLALNDGCPALLQALLFPLTLAGAHLRPPWPLMRLVTRFLGPRDRLALLDRDRFQEFYPSFLGAMRSGCRAVYGDGHAFSQPWPFDVSAIRVPVRIWHGTQDSNFHYSLAGRLAARIPGAAFMLRDEGHYSLPFFHVRDIVTDLLACRAGAGTDRLPPQG